MPNSPITFPLNTKTDEEVEEERNKNDRLRQGKLTSKLNQLLSRLLDCNVPSGREMPNYKTCTELGQRVSEQVPDLDMFDDLFIVAEQDYRNFERRIIWHRVPNEIQASRGCA